ncbi:helix-turn-helix transcriptional regulator [Bradyrhizobium sp. CCBAU 53415]|uniref:helix-turn-helix transcriptional regulator n=1 Tax=Bradyrhizobium sp. CCBAU 53415 TaxID=1325119 RepID=UPI002305E9CD|nr:helix-turn-helix transcriptional regulator [Bradyrhizobium sp. CCBAU 53415]
MSPRKLARAASPRAPRNPQGRHPGSAGQPGAVPLSAAHRVSPRTIQLLLEQAGITYSDFVLEQRLLRADPLLRNPVMRTRRIIEIAHLAGFHDVSYLHRVFRRHFGQTPDDVRRLADDPG